MGFLEPVHYHIIGEFTATIPIVQWSPVGIYAGASGTEALPTGTPSIVGVAIRATAAGGRVPICGVGALIWVRGDATINVSDFVIGAAGGKVTVLVQAGTKYPMGQMITKIDADGQLGVIHFIPTMSLF